jgi:tRNA pseudouridine65 synthase
MSDISHPYQHDILYIDEHFVAIDKPEGFFVHPPEDARQRKFVDPAKVVLSHLRRQLGLYLYPVHRLDVATSGVLFFALSKEKARQYCELQEAGLIEKTYQLICRGWTEDEFEVNLPLELDSTQVPVQSLTTFKSLARFEVEALPGGKYPRSRYALLQASPKTGRWHQIRRHLNRVSRPIIGDNDHGDSRHNRYFREKFGIGGLCLRACASTLTFKDGTHLAVQATPTEKWQKIFDFIQAHEVKTPDLSAGTSLTPRSDVLLPTNDEL